MIRVAVFIYGSVDSACPVIRLISPLDELSDNQIIKYDICNIDETLDERKLYEFRKVVRKSDIVILQRYIPVAVLKAVGFDLLKSKTLIYETDDNLLSVPESNPVAENYSKLSDEIKYIVNLADCITVSTNNLKETLSSFHDNIVVLDNYIDRKLWGNLLQKRYSSENDKVNIFYSGSFTHKEDLELIRPLYERLYQRYNDKLVFNFVGCALDSIAGNGNSDLSYRNYYDYAAYISSCHVDIAIAPLIDNDFNRAKSNLKYLEYSYCGFPGVYSSVEPYETTVDDNQDGFLVKDNSLDIWYDAISHLIDNPNCREEFARVAQEKIVEKFLLENNWQKWAGLFESLLSK